VSLEGFDSTYVTEIFVMKEGSNFSADAKAIDGPFKCQLLQPFTNRKMQSTVHTALE